MAKDEGITELEALRAQVATLTRERDEAWKNGMTEAWGIIDAEAQRLLHLGHDGAAYDHETMRTQANAILDRALRRPTTNDSMKDDGNDR